jgi:hypothetical protein
MIYHYLSLCDCLRGSPASRWHYDVETVMLSSTWLTWSSIAKTNPVPSISSRVCGAGRGETVIHGANQIIFKKGILL